ncbi:MAG: DUF4097 family beta strand repeat-containing protein [Vicinamibacteria bacterium]
MRLSWLVALGGLAVAAAVPAGADEWSRQYAVKGRPDVHVKAGDGEVRIEPGAPGEVSARVTTVGWKIGDGGITIRESQAGDRVEIEVVLPNLGLMGWGSRKIDVALRVPADSALDVRTGDGGIDAHGLGGTLSLSTGDGKIAVSGLRGDVKLHTGDGGITGTGLSGRLSADTGDGDVDVRGRFTGLDLETGDGDVLAAVESGSKLEGPWSVRTGDGSVTLRLPDGLDATLEARTGDGGIRLAKPLAVDGEVKENRLHGRLGAGGPLLSIRTGDGRIRLEGL